MEHLVKKRSPLRASFTKAYKSLMSLFDNESIEINDVKIKLATLERINADLMTLDNEILELSLSADDNGKSYSDEFESVEEYKVKFDEAKVCVNSFMESKKQPNVNTLNHEKSKLKLPKIELMKFGGEVKEWLCFWSQFKRIHEDKQMELEDKFQYLIQCMSPGTRAKEIIDSYPPTAENYTKAIESIKTRFGREELLVEYYVRELLTLVIKNATKSKLSITQLYDKLESHLRSLESIGMTSDKYAAMLFPLVESCIPEDILRVWLRNSSVGEEKSYSERLTQLLNFLRAEVEGEERITLAKSGIKQSDPYRKIQKDREDIIIPTASNLFSGSKEINSNKVINCIFCEKSHQSKDCYKAQNLNHDEKLKIMKEKNCCFSCLKTNHRAKNCKSKVHCMFCGRKHYLVCCPEFRQKSKVDVECLQKNCESSTLSSTCTAGRVLLQTLVVAIQHKGKKLYLRVLIDTGSEYSYVLKSTVEALGIKAEAHKKLTHVVFGGRTSDMNHKCYNINVENLHTGYSCKIPVLDQPIICGSIPSLQKGPWTSELAEKGIHITDVDCSSPQIDVLIGSDFAGNIYTGKIQKLRNGIFAMETLLGWVLMGKLQANEEGNSIAAVVTSLLIHNQDIRNLWELEAIGIKDPFEQKTRSETDKAVMDHFVTNLRKDDEGRYEVKLPWIHDKNLPEYKDIAERRLERTTAKLKLEGKYDAYNMVFEEWLKEKIIEKVLPEELSECGCYLPHRGIFKENSTTKVRPVFDASNKKKGFPSLNDCLEKGPNTLELIPSLLIRFREKRIGIISDIKKAFLQISIVDEDRDYLRFLWWKDSESKEIQVFRHRRVVFGVTCSPFILGAVIQYHLENTSIEHREIAKKLLKSFYVDNCVTSIDTESEAQHFIDVSTQLMASAKFELRGWEFTNFNVSTPEQEISQVLGLLWNRRNDTLSCEVDLRTEIMEPFTRRKLLSIAQRVFDPIGFCSPVTLYPKLLLQESWKSKLSWDDELPKDVTEKFMKWLKHLHLLKLVEIPRYMLRVNYVSISLHTFCDASKLSYATVIFLRCDNEDQVSVQLVLAKSRIAPLKEMSIPRLELMACTIGARLSDMVKKALSIQDIEEYYWTDSSSALYWIRNEDTWTVFVKNRVKEIRNLTNYKNWQHVQGTENPADLPSRGCSAKKLLESRWWEGPLWLKSNKRDWPKSENLLTEETLEEKKIVTPILLGKASVSEELLAYFSTYRKILRMISWILRFCNNARRVKQERQSGELDADELNEAERIIIKVVQTESFHASSLKELKSLCYFRDNRGLLRVKTKLTDRKDFENFKYPILLPSKHKLVKLLILEHHLTLHHAGLHPLLTILREKFWIINGRKTIRSVISKCIVCRRHSAKTIKTISVPLPEDRIRDASIFEVVGVDLAGPLILKGGTKAWFVLYTCAVFRAIHLELITSLSTNCFLLSLRRFIARRGRPQVIYSDNGTNFTGASNLFKAIDWKMIEGEASNKRIVWKFNPPTACWWGGFWERLIQIVKKLLRRVLKNSSLTYEEMLSLLCECEAIVNSRPLTYASEDPDELKPITPAMFLQELTEVGVPDLDHIDKINLTRRLRYQQKLRDELRKRFRAEYLGNLMLKRTNEKSSYELKVGDIVLIENEDKRTFWPLGRIIELYPGKDSNVRLVKVKTSNGEFLRPVQRLYPLEIQSQSEGSPVEADAEQEDISTSLQEILKERVNRSGRTIKLPSRFKDFEL